MPALLDQVRFCKESGEQLRQCCWSAVVVVQDKKVPYNINILVCTSRVENLRKLQLNSLFLLHKSNILQSCSARLASKSNLTKLLGSPKTSHCSLPRCCQMSNHPICLVRFQGQAILCLKSSWPGLSCVHLSRKPMPPSKSIPKKDVMERSQKKHIDRE